MKRELRLTEDGSHTVYVNDLDEPYHSIHGALQESRHVFINQGFQKIAKSPLHILELGLGTGLNMMLTLVEAESLGLEVYYYAVEKYPLKSEEYFQLNHEQVIEGLPFGSLVRMHEAPWDEQFQLSDTFFIHKEQADFRAMKPPGMFDLVYFDAFAPDKQPHLWSADIFEMLSHLVNPGGLVVSYTSKGSVRRALASNGFTVERVPGPPGKIEMIRATKR
ncbi:MAG: tRNA (5-methylaminomethyl-2-thiouridine)(34)-methyltransferase MnmD [Bacteroidales bacterium]|nr:tRNA (5-methylaminomethyl-2-thiouridine)(34)-methyltransferase MnmD [Bacteroidales bacterium]